GRITVVAKPEGPGVRVDGYEYAGWDVPLDYDPLLSKLVVWAASRPAAIARMQRALSEYHLGGIRTNLGFFRELLQDERFLSGRLHTGLIADFLSRRRPEAPPELAEIAALAAALDRAPSKPPQPAPAGGSPWKAEGRELLLR
ncbi:MAG: acetyl-CoA carboxylase biotin carboxylase subunit, partial [Acidobacteria bacterium]|nr:acetyl-CoA carboxylase biotin carboxylase subunit [Acidobacteriota bacterium]